MPPDARACPWRKHPAGGTQGRHVIRNEQVHTRGCEVHLDPVEDRTAPRLEFPDTQTDDGLAAGSWSGHTTYYRAREVPRACVGQETKTM